MTEHDQHDDRPTAAVPAPAAPPAAAVPAPAAPPAEEVVLLATPPDTRDISAELAAPPRRGLPWPTLLLAAAVIAAGAFAGGVQYQKSSDDGSAAAAGPGGRGARAAASGAPNAPGGQGAGQNGRRAGGQGQGQGGQGGAGGFTRGTVTSVEGNIVHLTDASGRTVKVTTEDSTRIQVTRDGKPADLQAGQTVTVIGTPDGQGGYKATQLLQGGTAGPGAGGFGGGFPGAGASGAPAAP